MATREFVSKPLPNEPNELKTLFWDALLLLKDHTTGAGRIKSFEANFKSMRPVFFSIFFSFILLGVSLAVFPVKPNVAFYLQIASCLILGISFVTMVRYYNKAHKNFFDHKEAAIKDFNERISEFENDAFVKRSYHMANYK